MTMDRSTQDRDRGAATLETTGMAIVAAILASALLVAAVPQARILGETASYWICQVVTFGQGGCTPPSTAPDAREPEEPCVQTQDGVERDAKVAVLFFTAEDGRRIQVERLSNGEYRVTVSDSGGLGVEAGVGGGLSLTVNDTTVGGNATASVGASLDIKDGDVYYADGDSIDGLLNALLQDQITDQVVGDDGPVRWITDQVTDVVGIGSQLPDPDETYVEGGISLNASAEATGGVNSASAGVDTATMLGVKNNRDGSTTIYLSNTVEGEAGLQTLGYDTDGDPQFQGADLSGSAQVVTAVTFDSEGNMTQVQSTTAYGGEGKGYAAALFGGDPDADLGNSAQSGTSITQATLPIRNGNDQTVANEYLLAMGVQSLGAYTNPLISAGATIAGLGPTQNFFEAVGSRGYLTQTSYDTDSTTVAAIDGSAELGIQVGVSGSVATDSMSITDAQYWDGTQWVPWEACNA